MKGGRRRVVRHGGRGGQAKARGTYFWWAAFPQSSPCCPKLKRHTLHHLSHHLPLDVTHPGRFLATRCSHPILITPPTHIPYLSLYLSIYPTSFYIIFPFFTTTHYRPVSLSPILAISFLNSVSLSPPLSYFLFPSSSLFTPLLQSCVLPI